MVRAAARQQLDQCEALEGVDGGDDQNVQGGRHDCRPLDAPEALEISRTIDLCSLDDGLVDVAKGGNIQNDGLADRSRQQDEDDAAQSEPLIAQPVDVLVDQAEGLAEVVEYAVVVVVHPLPDDRDSDRTGNDRQVEDTAEETGRPLGQVDDGRADPQRECTGNGNRNNNDDEGVLQRAKEDGVGEQFFIVCQTHEDVRAVHGRVKEARHHAQDHGIDNEAKEENQTWQKEQVGSDGFLPHQCAAAFRLLDFCSLCSQKNHQTFLSHKTPLPRRDVRGRGVLSSLLSEEAQIMPQQLQLRWRLSRRY
mgnify:CR=1 FL=1